MSPWRGTIGLMLIALGGLFLVDRAGYVDAGVVIGDWWPLTIVVLGALHWAANPRAVVGPALTILLGLLLLVGELHLVPGGLSALVWPLILIVVGGWILLGRGGRHGIAGNSQDSVDRFVAFGGLDLANQSVHFRGGSLLALFGGITLDLREAQLAPEGAALDVVAGFGGVDIRVPPNWRVNLSGLPLFGGLENKVRNGHLALDAPTLDVQATALFGGVEVKS